MSMPTFLMTTWTASRNGWTRRSDLLRTLCGRSQPSKSFTRSFRPSERTDLLDADEHPVACAVVREAGAVGGGDYLPARPVVGLVVDVAGAAATWIAQH